MARRSKGEGIITQRKDGSWQGALQIEGKRRFVTGKTDMEVKAKLADLQREAHQSGGLSDPGAMPGRPSSSRRSCVAPPRIGMVP